MNFIFDRKKISERLVSERARKGVLSKDVAAALGVSGASMSQFEAGIITPSVPTLIALADYFDVSIDFLVGRTDNPFISPTIMPSIESENSSSELESVKKRARPFFKLGKESFSDRLVFEMIEKGVTAEDVAKAIGISGSDVSKLQAGMRPPLPDEWKKLAKYFGVSMDYLLGNTNDPDAGSTDYAIGESILNESTDAISTLLRKVMTVRDMQTNPEERKKWEMCFDTLQNLIGEHHSYKTTAQRLASIVYPDS